MYILLRPYALCFILAGDPASQSAAEQHEIPSIQQLAWHVEQQKDEAIRRVVQLLSSRSRLGGGGVPELVAGRAAPSLGTGQA